MSGNVPIDVIYSSEDTPDSRCAVRTLPNRQDESVEREEQNHRNLDSKGDDDVPPDGGYGWVCVACVFWINAHTWGVNSVCPTEELPIDLVYQ